MVVSLVKMAEQGGYLPRWPSGGGYTGSMFGTPADIVIAESYLKGIRDFDVESAYGSCGKRPWGRSPPDRRFPAASAIEHYLKHEYCPADLMKKSVASTIEYCYADQAIARLAEALGHRDDAVMFQQHGRFYRNLWNPETQFFHPRDSQGKFLAEFNTGMLTYVDRAGQIHARVCRGERLAMALGRPFGCRGIGVAVQESRVLRAGTRAVFRPLARRRRTEAECLLLAREPTRSVCRLSLQLCQPSRPDAEVGPVDSGDEVRGS